MSSRRGKCAGFDSLEGEREEGMKYEELESCCQMLEAENTRLKDLCDVMNMVGKGQAKELEKLKEAVRKCFDGIGIVTDLNDRLPPILPVKDYLRDEFERSFPEFAAAADLLLKVLDE